MIVDNSHNTGSGDILFLRLKRIFKGDKYTIGCLYIGKTFFCNTLEDRVRDIPKEPKVYGQTAIPSGTYEVDMNTISPKFKNRSWAKKYKGIVPRLKNVPYFEGVLIHPGNSESDTDGCILVGENTIQGRVVNSQRYFSILMDKYLIPWKNSGKKIIIEIK